MKISKKQDQHVAVYGMIMDTQLTGMIYWYAIHYKYQVLLPAKYFSLNTCLKSLQIQLHAISIAPAAPLPSPPLLSPWSS